MTCMDCRRIVHGWIDGELTREEGDEFAEHLATCLECADLADQERSFVEGLQKRLPRSVLSPSERRQILGDLHRQSKRRKRLRWTAWSGTLALAASLVLVAGLVFAQAKDWTRFYRMDHAAHAGLTDGLEIRSGSAEEVAAWMEREVGARTHVPVMADARLLGARSIQLRGTVVGLAVYESGGRKISLFLGNPHTLCPSKSLVPDQLFTRAGQPYSVVAWVHQGHFHVAVSDLPPERLQELARQCQKPAT